MTGKSRRLYGTFPTWRNTARARATPSGYLDCKQVARWNLDAFTLVQDPKDPKAPVHIFHPDTGALMGILLPCILKEAGHGR